MGGGVASGKRRACSGGGAASLSAAFSSREPPLPLRRVLLLALGLIALAPAAFAQLREGRYAVEGQNPDGTPYDGEFELREGPNGAWLARWLVGNAQIIGLGLIQSGMLAISFVVDNRPGVAIYGVEPDGSLRGTWTTGGGLGTETFKPQ